MKINTDAAFHDGQGAAVLILRDSTGTPLFYQHQPFEAQSPDMAEALASKLSSQVPPNVSM